jgi:dTDP-4-dehydrorhamnose 3,5-epimerase
VKLIERALGGVMLLEPQLYGDDRGWFCETFNSARFAELGLPTQFLQSNLSRSRQGVLRGLHYQWPNPQGKLVQVVEGEVLDVAVDLRRGSASFGQSYAARLSADNRRVMYVPEGYAHGFAVLSEQASFAYQCTALYDRSCDRAVRWNDPALAIDWLLDAPLLSPKDATAPLLADLPEDALPVVAR